MVEPLPVVAIVHGGYGERSDETQRFKIALVNVVTGEGIACRKVVSIVNGGFPYPFVNFLYKLL